jgi:hypothetical protein
MLIKHLESPQVKNIKLKVHQIAVMKTTKNLRSLIMMMKMKTHIKGEEKQEQETGEITVNQVF